MFLLVYTRDNVDINWYKSKSVAGKPKAICLSKLYRQFSGKLKNVTNMRMPFKQIVVYSFRTSCIHMCLFVGAIVWQKFNIDSLGGQTVHASLGHPVYLARGTQSINVLLLAHYNLYNLVLTLICLMPSTLLTHKYSRFPIRHISYHLSIYCKSSIRPIINTCWIV